MRPKFSFLCPTFDRVDLLAECVYWFTQQTECSRSELLILSDGPQRLVCKVPGVTILWYPNRIRTLGLKRNLLIDAARGEILLPQDDDDISLPHRAKQAEEKLENAEFFDPQARWYEENGRLFHDHAQNCTLHAAAWRRGTLRYRDELTVGEDQAATQDARKLGLRHASGLTRPADWSYVYRWGVSRRHLSASPGGVIDPTQPSPDIFEIIPTLRKPYDRVCSGISAALATPNPHGSQAASRPGD